MRRFCLEARGGVCCRGRLAPIEASAAFADRDGLRVQMRGRFRTRLRTRYWLIASGRRWDCQH